VAATQFFATVYCTHPPVGRRRSPCFRQARDCASSRTRARKAMAQSRDCATFPGHLVSLCRGPPPGCRHAKAAGIKPLQFSGFRANVLHSPRVQEGRLQIVSKALELALKVFQQTAVHCQSSCRLFQARPPLTGTDRCRPVPMPEEGRYGTGSKAPGTVLPKAKRHFRLSLGTLDRSPGWPTL
jgi:hypothetical protein